MILAKAGHGGEFPLRMNRDVFYPGQHGSGPWLTWRVWWEEEETRTLWDTREDSAVPTLGKAWYFTTVNNYKQDFWLQSMNDSNMQCPESDWGISTSYIHMDNWFTPNFKSHKGISLNSRLEQWNVLYTFKWFLIVCFCYINYEKEELTRAPNLIRIIFQLEHMPGLEYTHLAESTSLFIWNLWHWADQALGINRRGLTKYTNARASWDLTTEDMVTSVGRLTLESPSGLWSLKDLHLLTTHTCGRHQWVKQSQDPHFFPGDPLPRILLASSLLKSLMSKPWPSLYLGAYLYKVQTGEDSIYTFVHIYSMNPRVAILTYVSPQTSNQRDVLSFLSLWNHGRV